MTLRLTRLDANIPIVNEDGTPTQQHLRLFNGAMQAIEEAFAANEALNTAQSALITEQADQLALILTAQSTATNAARETARINSYTSPTSVVTAVDAGSDATITIAAHTRVYPVQGTVDVPDVVISLPADIMGLAFSTLYHVYYDDTTLAGTTPAYVATTTAGTAQVGAAAGRHYVGSVTTPADGGGGSSGSGGAPPGGGGGHPV